MSSPCGFALVGCGDISDANAHAISAAEGARLVRLVDPRTEAARPEAERYRVPVSHSLAESLEDDSVEAVFIATPHHLHAPMVIEAALAGRHVIVEKPIATTLAAAEEAIATCADCGVRLGVAHPRRYDDKVRLARELFEGGLIGDLILTSSSFYKVKGAEYWERSPWRGSLRQSGGGVMIMNLLHHLDTLQTVTGDRVTSVAAEAVTLATEVEVEDTAVAMLRYECGALGTLSSATASAGPTVIEDVFVGREGRIVVRKDSVAAVSATAGPPWHSKEWRETVFSHNSRDKVRLVEEFAASISSGTEPPVGGGYGFDLLKLVLESGIPTAEGCEGASH